MGGAKHMLEDYYSYRTRENMRRTYGTAYLYQWEAEQKRKSEEEFREREFCKTLTFENILEKNKKALFNIVVIDSEHNVYKCYDEVYYDLKNEQFYYYYKDKINRRFYEIIKLNQVTSVEVHCDDNKVRSVNTEGLSLASLTPTNRSFLRINGKKPYVDEAIAELSKPCSFNWTF